MVRLLALWIAFLAMAILWAILREERLSAQGRVPLGRLRRLWLKTDRRGAPRYRVDWIARYYAQGNDSGNGTAAETRDVSRTGACLILRERPEIGRIIYLDVRLPQQPELVRVQGKVVRTREFTRKKDPRGERLFYVGVHFVEIDVDLLEKIAAGLNGQNPFKRPGVVQP